MKKGWLTPEGELTQAGREELDARKSAHPARETSRAQILAGTWRKESEASDRVSLPKVSSARRVEDAIEEALARRGVNGGRTDVRVKSQRGSVFVVVIVLNRTRKAGGRQVLRLHGTLQDLVENLRYRDFHGITCG